MNYYEQCYCYYCIKSSPGLRKGERTQKNGIPISVKRALFKTCNSSNFQGSNQWKENSMKRKDFEYDFPSLSLSRKSRRLDGERLSVMEEDPGTKVPQLAEDQRLPTTSIVRSNFTSSEERALGLYNPPSTPFLKSPSSLEFPIFVHSDLIPGLKDCLIWPGEGKKMGFEPAMDESSGGSNNCLAVIPWAATSLPSDTIDPKDTDIEMMEMDESTVANNNNNNNIALQYSEMMELSEGFQPWQQPQNISAPITW